MAVPAVFGSFGVVMLRDDIMYVYNYVIYILTMSLPGVAFSGRASS